MPADRNTRECAQQRGERRWHALCARGIRSRPRTGVALALRQAGADAGAAAAIHIIMDSVASAPHYASEQISVPGQLTDLSYALRE